MNTDDAASAPPAAARRPSTMTLALAAALMLACRARALLRGRVAPSVEDLEALAEPALGHRMALKYDPTGETPALPELIRTLANRAR